MSKKIIATNPVAKHNYEIIDTLEAGLVLSGRQIGEVHPVGQLFSGHFHGLSSFVEWQYMFIIVYLFL